MFRYSQRELFASVTAGELAVYLARLFRNGGLFRFSASEVEEEAIWAALPTRTPPLPPQRSQPLPASCVPRPNPWPDRHDQDWRHLAVDDRSRGLVGDRRPALRPGEP